MTVITPLLRVKERIAGPSGIFGIENEWYGYRDQWRFTVGLAGMSGFGIGCCPPELLPADFAPLSSGTYDPLREHPHFGNYIHIPSASIVCFIPAHYIDVQAPGNTNAPFYGTKVVISDTQSGNGVLPKAFTDSGQSLIGVFVDKYQISNGKPDGTGAPNNTSGPGGTPLTGGIAVSRPLQWPVSPITKDNGGTDFNSPFSLVNSTALNTAATTPTDNLGGVWALVKTRGADFAPIPIWVRSQIAFLSLAHAQALLDTGGSVIAGATTKAAWMDVAPYAPKGNNNNGSDVNKSSLQFARTDLTGHNGSGYAGRNSRAFTGAARISGAAAVEHTTHNGQLSGIVDIQGNQWEIAPGLTCVGTSAGDMRLFPSSGDWTATTGNASITGATGVLSLAAESGAAADDGVWWTSTGTSNYLVAHADGTFHPSSEFSDATLRAMTETMLPRELGTSLSQTATNIYGGDRFYSDLVNDLLPRVGGRWADTASAGVFFVILATSSSYSNSSSGARAVRLLAA